jgi:hypothetical protein
VELNGLSGGRSAFAEQYLSGSAQRMNALGGGLGRLWLDGQQAQLYYATRLYSPGAAEQFFGAGQRRFGQEVVMLGNAFTGGAGQPLSFRLGYTVANLAQFESMFSKLGEARALAEVGTVAELAEEARAVRAASEGGLLRTAGLEGEPSAALFQELEVMCQKPTAGMAELEAEMRLAPQLEYKAAEEIKATAQAAETQLTEAELAQSAKQLEFGFTKQAEATAAEELPDAYAGIRQASQYLQEMGVPRAKRVEWLQGFEAWTVRLRNAGANEFGLRYFDNVNAYPKGRWLFETLPQSRESLALKTEWNQMVGFKQWQVRPGTIIIEGNAASQGLGLSGGAWQKFILNIDDLLNP